EITKPGLYKRLTDFERSAPGRHLIGVNCYRFERQQLAKCDSTERAKHEQGAMRKIDDAQRSKHQCQPESDQRISTSLIEPIEKLQKKHFKHGWPPGPPAWDYMVPVPQQRAGQVKQSNGLFALRHWFSWTQLTAKHRRIIGGHIATNFLDNVQDIELARRCFIATHDKH